MGAVVGIGAGPSTVRKGPQAARRTAAAKRSAGVPGSVAATGTVSPFESSNPAMSMALPRECSEILLSLARARQT